LFKNNIRDKLKINIQKEMKTEKLFI